MFQPPVEFFYSVIHLWSSQIIIRWLEGHLRMFKGLLNQVQGCLEGYRYVSNRSLKDLSQMQDSPFNDSQWMLEHFRILKGLCSDAWHPLFVRQE